MVVVPHISTEHPNAEQHGCGDMTIPASSIKKVVELTESGLPEKQSL